MARTEIFTDFWRWAHLHTNCFCLPHKWKAYKGRKDLPWKGQVETFFPAQIKPPDQTHFVAFLGTLVANETQKKDLEFRLACMNPFVHWAHFKNLRMEKCPLKGVILHGDNAAETNEVLMEWMEGKEQESRARVFHCDSRVGHDEIQKLADQARAFLKSRRVAIWLALRCPASVREGVSRILLRTCSGVLAAVVVPSLLLPVACLMGLKQMPLWAGVYSQVAPFLLLGCGTLFILRIVFTRQAGKRMARDLKDSPLVFMRSPNAGEDFQGQSYKGAALLGAVVAAIRREKGSTGVWADLRGTLDECRARFCITGDVGENGDADAFSRIELRRVERESLEPKASEVVTGKGLVLIAPIANKADLEKEGKINRRYGNSISWCRCLTDVVVAAANSNLKRRLRWTWTRLRVASLLLGLFCLLVIPDACWIAEEAAWESEEYWQGAFLNGKMIETTTGIDIVITLDGVEKPERYRVRWDRQGWPSTEPKRFRRDGKHRGICRTSFRDLGGGRYEDLDTHKIVSGSVSGCRDVILDRGRFILGIWACSWRERLITTTPTVEKNTQP